MKWRDFGVGLIVGLVITAVASTLASFGEKLVSETSGPREIVVAEIAAQICDLYDIPEEGLDFDLLEFDFAENKFVGLTCYEIETQEVLTAI